MKNKKFQASMEIDVSFVGKTAELVKSLEADVSKVDLSSKLLKGTEQSVKRAFKEIYTDLDKMSSAIGKKGLNTKQYTQIFDTLNTRIKQNLGEIGNLGSALKNAFNSDANKQAIKDLKTYKKQLEEINKLMSAQKGAETRANTAKTKIKTETGLDVDSKTTSKMLSEIQDRLSNSLQPTKTQQTWLEKNGLDEKTLKRVYDLLGQVAAQQEKISQGREAGKKITGENTLEASQSKLLGNIASAEDVAIIEDMSKETENFSNAVKIAEQNEEEFSKSANAAADQLEREKESARTLKEVLAQFGIVISAAGIANYFKELAKSSFEFYKSLDYALNQIYIVSDLSSKAVDSLKTNFIGMARETGMALDDITTAAVLFYQQGLNTDEVMEMTEVTAQFAKVAGIDATDAADKLTAAVNGYCLSAEDAASVADKFNKVAAASAADINELSTAFSKAAAQANQAGVSMDNYLAYIATMEEATREAPENLGTSLKTIFSRMQQIKTGENTEDNTDVNNVETALKSVGIALRDTEGQLRDLEDIFDELGPKWQSLDRNTQAYLGTIIAGTRQQSRFITLMQNWDRVLELSEESANSAGQQALMHAKAMESIESKVQQLQVAWQEFISNLADSSIFKGIITTLTTFLDKVNSGSKPFFLLATAITAVLKQVTKLQGPIGKLFAKLGKGAKSVLSLNKNNLKLAKSYISSAKQVKTYTKAIDQNKAKMMSIGQENDALIAKMKVYEEAIRQTGDSEEDGGKSVEILKKEYADLQQQLQENINTYNQLNGENQELQDNVNKVAPNLENEKKAFQEVSAGVQNLAGGFAGLAMVTDGGISSIAQLASTFLGFVGMAIPAIAELSAAENTSIILLLVKLGPVILAGVVALISLVKTLGEALGNTDEKMSEAIDKMSDSVEEYSNAATKVKGAKSLLKNYEELSGKIYRTAQEQEKLNDLAQQLGDSLDVEVIEDQYGNLSVSIDEVREKISALIEDQEDARKEMIKTEHESIEEFDHRGKVDEFYDRYLKSHRTDVRKAMSDIELDIDSSELKTDAKNVESIMDELKNSIIDDSNEMAEAFGGAGIKWSLTEDVESAIKVFQDANIDNEQWNNLFGTFNNLQERLDSISYDKALEVVESAVKSWGEAAGLTTQQLNEMTDAIMNSLYAGSNLNKTISKYQKIIDKYSGTDLETRKQAYTKQKNDAWDAADNNGEWDLYNPFYKSDEEAEYESAKKKLKLLEKEEEAYRNIKSMDEQINKGLEYGYDINGNYVKLLDKRNELAEKYNIASYEEEQRAERMRELLGQMNDVSGEWIDRFGLFEEDSEKILLAWQESGMWSKMMDAFKVDENQATQLLTTQLVNIIENTDDEEMKRAAQEKLDNVFKGVTVSGIMSWSELGEGLQNASEDLRKMNSLMQEFKETGAFTLDTFIDLCDVLDTIDISQVFDAGQMNKYLHALDTLQLGFDASTGMITANKDALISLQEIQEMATQAKLKQMSQSLEADKASLLSQIYCIQAEISANEALIEELKAKGDTSVKIDELELDSMTNYTGKMLQASQLSANIYYDMTQQSSSWAKTSIANAAQVGEAVKAAMTGNLGQANLNSYLKNIVSTWDYKSTGSYAQLDILKDKNGFVKVQDAIAALEKYNQKGRNTIDELYAQIKGIESMQGLLNKMADSGLGKLGTDLDDAGDSADRYLGKLWEIFNIINKIEAAEKRLAILEKANANARGKAYSDLYQRRLALQKKVAEYTEQEIKEQKNLVISEQEAIKNSPVGDVFSFNEYGTIIIDYEKYLKLQDKSIDGEQTLKELADNLYDEYEELYDNLLDYAEGYVDKLQEIIDMEQEQIDTYIDLEHSVAEAVKEIYQEMLDTKLEAIDREIEALDKLQEARERNNQQLQNSRDLSKMQTSLNRSLMDTSGASSIKQLDYRDQIRQKLEDMGEDAYSQRMDDIKDALSDQKDMLQREFDEFFKDWEQLYTMVEERILDDEDAVLQVLKTTSDFKEASSIQRRQLLDEWSTKYAAAMSGLQDGYTIGDLYDDLTNLKDNLLDKVDTLLSTDVRQDMASRVGKEVSDALRGYYDSITSAINSAAGRIASASSSAGSPTSGGISRSSLDASANTINNANTVLPTKTSTNSIPDSKFSVGDKVRSNSGSTLAPWKNNNGSFSQKTGLLDAYLMLGSYKILEKQYDKNRGLWFYKLNTTPAAWFSGLQLKYKQGGLADFTGPAWLDGTKSAPEAVLNAAQTKAFMSLVDNYDKLQSGLAGSTANVVIESISFNVDSMSSPEDGERAFNVFVEKFNDIGKRTGLSLTPTRKV
jgi:TP901 family phage tail tape measure protein